MSIVNVSLKELLCSIKTKSRLTEFFGEALLQEFESSLQTVVVVYNTITKSNQPLHQGMETHGHEEADTLIPLHVLDAIVDTTLRSIDVWSLDTDVFIDLLDLVAHGLLGASTELRFTTGTGTKRRVIDICKCIQQIGVEKCKGLIGLHNFSGVDWGGKFVGVSKKTWITSFLNLPDSDPVINVFQQMGQSVLDFGDATSTIPGDVQPLGDFCVQFTLPVQQLNGFQSYDGSFSVAKIWMVRNYPQLLVHSSRTSKEPTT